MATPPTPTSPREVQAKSMKMTNFSIAAIMKEQDNSERRKSLFEQKPNLHHHQANSMGKRLRE